jgi:hypothetical protein
MKRILSVLFFFVCCVSIHTSAQVMGGTVPFVQVGFKLGGNFQGLSKAPIKTGPGVLAGIYARKSVERFGLRIEVLGGFNKYTTKYPASYYSLPSPNLDTISKGEFQSISLYAPVMVEYFLTNRLQVVAGGQYGLNLSMTDNNNAFTKIYGEDKFLKKSEIAIIAGVEYFYNKHVMLGARLTKGITDINNSTYYLVPTTWTSTGIQVSISYKIL